MQHRPSFLFVLRFRISSKQTREGLGVESGSLPAGQFSSTDLHCNSENRPQQAKGSKVQYLAGINKAVGGSHFWKRLSYLRSQFLRTPKDTDGDWHFFEFCQQSHETQLVPLMLALAAVKGLEAVEKQGLFASLKKNDAWCFSTKIIKVISSLAKA